MQQRLRGRGPRLLGKRGLTPPYCRALVWAGVCVATLGLVWIQLAGSGINAPVPPAAQPQLHKRHIIERRPRLKVAHVDALNDTQGAACFSEGCQIARAPEAVLDVRLLVGVISAPGDAALRAGVRQTWARAADNLAGVRVLFFAATSARAFLDEQAAHGDVLLSNHEHDDMPVGFRMLAQLAAMTNVQNVLRVDVGCYVLVPRLLAALNIACHEPECVNQAVWAGQLVANATVEAAHADYQQMLGLPTYLPFMDSAAFVISHSLVRALALMHERIGLRAVGPEAIAMGLWLVPIPVHRIDLSEAMHLTPGCCFDAATGRPTVDVCTKLPAPAVVVGSLESAEHMHMYHEEIQRCRAM